MVVECMNGVLGKVIAIGTASAFIYHLLGGIRHLVMDMGHWEELQSGDVSAKVVIALWVVLTIVVGVILI